MQDGRNAGVQEDLESALAELTLIGLVQLTTFELNCCDRNLPRPCCDASNGTSSRRAASQVPQETQVSFYNALVSYTVHV